jgi:hypothetical protein
MCTRLVVLELCLWGVLKLVLLKLGMVVTFDPTGAKITKAAAKKGKRYLLLPNTSCVQRKVEGFEIHFATW